MYNVCIIIDSYTASKFLFFLADVIYSDFILCDNKEHILIFAKCCLVWRVRLSLCFDASPISDVCTV